MRDGRPFGFAGLWESWKHDGEVLETCTILTTEPNELAREIHDRMPVIVPPAHYVDWLDAAKSGTQQTSSILGPYPASAVSSVRFGDEW
jgi:putative SOS response-associated peptidase YedK